MRAASTVLDLVGESRLGRSRKGGRSGFVGNEEGRRSIGELRRLEDGRGWTG